MMEIRDNIYYGYCNHQYLILTKEESGSGTAKIPCGKRPMGQTGTYKRSLGLAELVSLGVGGTVGSGIFVVPGVAAQLSGPASLLAWAAVAVSASCVVLSLAFIAFRFTGSYSFYELFESVFGVKVAVLLMSLYLVASVFGIATIAAGIGQYLEYFGISQVLPVEAGIIIAFCLLNIRGIALSGKTEDILTILKIAPLVIIALLLLPFVRWDNFVPGEPVTSAGIFATIIIVYWPFTGFEISALMVSETKDPALIRRSLLLVMLIVVSLYLILNIALIGSLGSQVLAASPAPIATAAGLIFPYSGIVVAVIGIVAMLSAINAYIIASSRVIHSLSTRFHIPILGSLSKQGTPVQALITGGGISAALLFFSNRFNELAIISVITILIPYMFFCIAAWILVRDARFRIVSAAGVISTAAILLLWFILR
jgi:amino acid transporter